MDQYWADWGTLLGQCESIMRGWTYSGTFTLLLAPQLFVLLPLGGDVGHDSLALDQEGSTLVLLPALNTSPQLFLQLVTSHNREDQHHVSFVKILYIHTLHWHLNCIHHWHFT